VVFLTAAMKFLVKHSAINCKTETSFIGHVCLDAFLSDSVDTPLVGLVI